MNKAFNPQEKEDQLRRESESWDTSQIKESQPGDIPVIDVAEYFTTGSDQALEDCAKQLGYACRNTGFYSLTGHQFPPELRKAMFEQVQLFHALPQESKRKILMDREDWPVKGVGYMPFKNTKLPTRSRGNLNEAFIVKQDHVVTLDDSQWPDAEELPMFRETVERYARAVENLALKLLPIYARSLELDKNFFEPAFTRPLYRLRMTRYPPVQREDAEFGIPPHVDTTFFTILAQDSAGLSIFSEPRQCWIYAPLLDDAFIINTGELLKQWSNDVFISVKHFANNNTGNNDRYSIPFFFNTNGDYPMECLPTCCNENNPPKYPTISYLESQAVAQGE